MEPSPQLTVEQAVGIYAAFDTDSAPIQDFLVWLLNSYGVPEARPRVLDVGCGPGRLLLSLAARGWRVRGIEPDPEYSAYATTAAARVPNASVTVGSFNDVAADDSEAGAYDLVRGINGSFSYLLTSAARADALARCRRALRTGGVLFLDMPNLLRALFEYRGPATLENTTGGRHIHLVRRHEVDFTEATFTTFERFAISETEGRSWVLHKKHPMGITTWPELSQALSAVGFTDLRVYTSWAARAAESPDAGRRLMVSARAG